MPNAVSDQNIGVITQGKLESITLEKKCFRLFFPLRNSSFSVSLNRGSELHDSSARNERSRA